MLKEMSPKPQPLPLHSKKIFKIKKELQDRFIISFNILHPISKALWVGHHIASGGVCLNPDF